MSDDMIYRYLGKSGLQVSALSFGSWVTFGSQVDTDLGYNLMKTAYDAGINFFDNAEVYANGRSEEIMGQALKRLGWDRDTYCVSSKVFWGGPKPTQKGLSRKHIFDACHAALRRLGVDYLDMYFCHRPDIKTPIVETVRAMSDLVAQGKVMYWGTSEWSAAQIAQAHSAAREWSLVPPTMEQPQYNMFSREKVEAEYAGLYSGLGLGTTIWSPLASGILTGKYTSGIPENTRVSLDGYQWLRNKVLSEKGQEQIRKTEELRGIAQDLGGTIANLAIAWCLANPNVSTVILGASRESQLVENLKSLAILPQLSEDILEKIEGILGNKPASAPDFRAL